MNFNDEKEVSYANILKEFHALTLTIDEGL